MPPSLYKRTHLEYPPTYQKQRIVTLMSFYGESYEKLL